MDLETPLDVQREPEINVSRRAFPVAQSLLSGGVVRIASPAAPVGWFGTTVFAETGSVAVVRAGGPLEELVGEIVAVSYGGRSVYAYVAISTALLEEDVDLSLSRRTFLALAPLYAERLVGVVAITA